MPTAPNARGSVRPRPFDLLLALTAPMLVIAFVLLRTSVLAIARLAGLLFVPISPWALLALASALVLGLLVFARGGARRVLQPDYPIVALAFTFLATAATTWLAVGWSRGYLSAPIAAPHAVHNGERIVGIATGARGDLAWARGDDWLASRIGGYLPATDARTPGHDLSCLSTPAAEGEVLLLLADARGERVLVANRVGYVARMSRIDGGKVCAPVDPARNPWLANNPHLTGEMRLRAAFDWSAIEDERRLSRGYGDMGYGAAVLFALYAALLLATIASWIVFLGRRARAGAR